MKQICSKCGASVPYLAALGRSIHFNLILKPDGITPYGIYCDGCFELLHKMHAENYSPLVPSDQSAEEVYEAMKDKEIGRLAQTD